MISTPISPAIVASQRRTPTFSPRKAIDNAVTNSGAMKPVADASAMGRKRSPEIKNNEDDNSATPRMTCRPGRSDCKANSRVPGNIAGTMIIANTRKRIHAISIEGSVADRYFAVTSEAPRNIVDARISAMPLNGRSARAGALGAVALAGALAAADFFSGKGNGALSSLAATAGGGVTAISKGNNYGIGQSFKKGHLDGNDKVWKRDTDMRDCARRPAAAGAAPLSQYFVK